MTKAIELSQLGSNIDVDTEIESSLPLRTNNATYGNNTNVPYLIAGTSGWTGATTNWDTFGLQHRLKSNDSGSPRVTIDGASGELFGVHNNGNVGIGTAAPACKLSVNGEARAGRNTLQYIALQGNASYNGVFAISDPGNAKNFYVAANADSASFIGGTLGNQPTLLITNNVERMRVDTAGNVGIGTGTPFTTLHVLNSGTGTSVANSGTTDTTTAARIARGSVGIDIGVLNNGTSYLQNRNVGDFATNYNFAINPNSGNVGIRTAAPGQTLHVNHNTTPKIRFSRGSSYYWDIGHTGSDFQFESQTGGVIMHMNYNGNVGIGTNNPTSKLHIQGTSVQIAGAFGSNVTYGGRSIQANHDIRATSMRGGILVRNMNDFRSETASASFMHYDAYTTSAKSYAFRVSRGATLSDTFWVKSDGSMYAASAFSGNSISLTSNITQTSQAPQHIFRETGTTYGNTTWALVRDGDSFSIRWNNAGPYVFRAATSGGSVSSVFLRQNGLEVNASGTVIAGSLSKGSGSFRIQHPLDDLSETTDLVHSFVEAPDASNLYAGMVDLVDGTATVNIDTAHRMTEGTFVALNHVQSWSSSNESGYAPVKCSISGNLLTIECQDTNSTDTVYYEVRGIRKDQHMIDTDWTDDNGRVITEPPKRAVPE